GSGRRLGMTLVSVVLGTSSEAARNANTLALLDYGFERFRLVTPVRAGAVIARPAVRDQPGVHAAVIAARTFTRVVATGARVSVRVQLSHRLAGPLTRHAIVGRVLVLGDGHTIGHVPLLLARPLAAAPTSTPAARLITRPSSVVSMVVLFGAAIALALAIRRRERGRRRDQEGAESA